MNPVQDKFVIYRIQFTFWLLSHSRKFADPLASYRIVLLPIQDQILGPMMGQFREKGLDCFALDSDAFVRVFCRFCPLDHTHAKELTTLRQELAGEVRRLYDLELKLARAEIAQAEGQKTSRKTQKEPDTAAEQEK